MTQNGRERDVEGRCRSLLSILLIRLTCRLEEQSLYGGDDVQELRLIDTEVEAEPGVHAIASEGINLHGHMAQAISFQRDIEVFIRAREMGVATQALIQATSSR
jgi:hypothetical protein